MSSLPDRIEALIAETGLAVGDRLPSERQLAVALGVSRPRLREAIKQLASQGQLVSHRGDGTYVTEPDRAEPLMAALLPLSPLARDDAGYWRDILEIRKSLEGDAAAFAALRADGGDRARIRAAYDALASALLADNPEQAADGSPITLAKLDAGFHMAIARAAHNVVLYQVMTGLVGLLETSISASLVRLYRIPGVPAELDAQHRRILDAVLAGRADEARATATEHLLFVEARLERIDMDFARQKRALRGLRRIGSMKEALS